MLHYHGTPITPMAVLYEMSGRNFCVSFAAPGDLKRCLTIGQSVMGDNGAFSVHTRGVKSDWVKYQDWVEPWLRQPNWAVIPDTIGGEVEDNIALAKAWRHPKEVSCMVWHLHEPLDHLARIADEYPRLAFGSSGLFWEPSSEAWRRRVDSAWNLLERSGRRPWVHMLRAMKQASEGPWPFASADSTNVARNHAGSTNRARLSAERMAKDIDSKNPPTSYVERHEHADFFS